MGSGIIIVDNEKLLDLKRAIAQELDKKGYEQSKISKILGITQPMVSNYLSSIIKLDKGSETHLKTILKQIETGKTIQFNTSIILNESDKTVQGQYFLARQNELITDEKQKIIDNLTQSFTALKDKKITDMIPKVRINIAMCKEDAADKDDVASFSNGLIIIDDKIDSISSIQFGKSNHLAELLLYLKKELDINAIMNIRLNKGTISKLPNSELTKDFKLKDKKKTDILIHKGDFGIEPCAYVIGKDAVDIAKKIVLLTK